MPTRPVDLRSRLRYVALCAAAVLAAQAAADRGAAQQTGEADYFDVNADRSTLRSTGGETILELIDNVVVVHGDVTLNADHGLSYSIQRLTLLDGNVKVLQGDMTMTGSEGEYRQNEDLAILRKNVRIVDPGWVITCDEARYSRTTGQAWLVGNVVARDSTSVLKTDRLLYERGVGRAEAFGNVELTSENQGIVVRGRHGVYHRNRGEGVIDRDPVLISGPNDPEPVNVVADTMRVFPDSSRATAYYRVRIIKGNTVTQCDSAMVFDDLKRIELYGNPIARQANTTMRGERMIAYYNENEIYQVDVEGKAEIVEAATDSMTINRDSRIRGNAMTLYMQGSGVDSLRVRGDASSEYFPDNPRKIESNSVRGQQMFFRFGERAIDYVDVAGNADGVYRYVDLAFNETADSLRAAEDTLLTYVDFTKRGDEVAYAADHVQYYSEKKQLVLHDGARVRYRNSELSGETITYYYDLQILDADGSPVLTETGQKLLGQRMGYDMDSETGLVTSGSTKYEQGYYSGENMAKVGENEMKVWNSYYTTCDLARPHFHFSARTMKVYPDDKVFTGPIWLHIGDTPVFVLPFMANSISRGRKSGFLRPDIEFGVTGSSGRFIRNIGYYWATNDYTDFTFVTDFNEDRSWRMHVQNRYALRYRFRGGLNFSYYKDLQDQSTEWTFDGSHNQNLGQRFTLDAQLRFVSSDEAPQSINTIDNVQRYIDRSIRSTVSVRKSWDTVGFSASASRTQNLNITDPRAVVLDMTLPDISVSIPSRNLWFGSNSGTAEGFWESLLKNTRYSPAVSANRRVNERLFETTDVTSGRAALNFSSPQRVRFVTLSPTLGMNFATTRTDYQREAHDEYRTIGGVIDTLSVAALDSLTTNNEFNWSLGANANTNFFGTFYPRIGRLRGIRHTLTPSASYNYTPPRNERPRQQSVALGLRNSIDIKIARPDTSSSGEEEMQKLSGVVIWNLGTRYTPDLPQNRAWSNISSTFNTVIAGANISLNHTVDPYNFDILNTSATAGFAIRGSHPFGRSSVVEVKELNVVAAADSADTTRTSPSEFAAGGVQFSQTGEFGEERPMGGELGLKEGRQPWSLSLGFSYSKGANGIASSTMRVGWDIKLTENWRIDYSTIYDVERLQLNGQNFGITRDLHCWAISFSRQQLGDEWQYYFRIALKAHPDLYGESGDRGVGSGLIGQF
ncbi:MAG: putative LPS assembly protein LptD [Candidatus Krumholzibacteria bacterium]|nr:putative LPS assembly protein LptD [Candidatus Krumholzibacteria bacterium]MDH5269760.1 putative LPS assembly protein LptD [Candidatus Krumholzibacteria bacterium]